CETNENTQLAITTKGFSAVCSVRLILAIYHILKKQNVVHIIACITEENETSRKFHERMGYENVGLFKKIGFKSGKWLDNFWMQKTLCPSDQPKEFVPFSSL
ncbi:GNAT family N-acetyltransferase, partial [Leuconostoc mesenteroides]|uniref:GNAT family N-acetyltransferase n=5 Tax=Leuconostoc mesenteroides TaxID=1245 RepID=UPI000B0FE767